MVAGAGFAGVAETCVGVACADAVASYHRFSTKTSLIHAFPFTVSPHCGNVLSRGQRAKYTRLASSFPPRRSASTSSPENVDALMLFILKLKSRMIPEHLVHTKTPSETHTDRGAYERSREPPSVSPSTSTPRQNARASVQTSRARAERVRASPPSPERVSRAVISSGRFIARRTRDPGPTHEKHVLFPLSRASAESSRSFLSADMTTRARGALEKARETGCDV